MKGSSINVLPLWGFMVTFSVLFCSKFGDEWLDLQI